MNPRLPHTAGLSAIGTLPSTIKGVPQISPIPSQAEIHARRLSERLELASAELPVRNSTMRQAYTGAELRTHCRTGSLDAFALPSQTCFGKTTPRGH